MKSKVVSLVILLTPLSIFLFVSCAQREQDPYPRTNIYDPGCSQWTQNAPPIITVTADSLWYDFNHSMATGTIRIHVLEDDLNFPYDTLTGSVFYNGKVIKLPAFSSKKDTAILLPGIKLHATPQCSVVVSDTKHSVISKVVTISTPDSIPAIPPVAKVINSYQQVTITWTRAPGTSYTVFYSDSLKGPFTDSIIVNPTSNSIITVTDQPSGYFPKYYIVAAKNNFGSARSTDTLMGRRYYSGISTPYINTVSQGTYPTYISLACGVSSINTIRQVEVYRSENDTNAFHFIGITNSTGSSYSYLYYNDSVETSATCYYRIYAIDNQYRCSFPSAIASGYLRRLSPPSLSISQYPDNIRLEWSSITDANKYRLYRSPINCIDSIKLLKETTSLNYIDTPPSNNIYYYSVSAVTKTNLEGSKSSCMQGRITVLPQPDSVFISNNLYPDYIFLSWRKINSANGYIVFRSRSSSFIDTLSRDTCLNNFYKDSVPDTSKLYYRIVAFNNKGTGILSSIFSGSAIIPSFSKYESRNDSVILNFVPNSRAIKYYIYRSANRTDFSLIDSITTTTYSAALKDFSTWYYRISIRVPEGVSYPSAAVSIVRQLSTPSNIQIIELPNSVKVQWNKVNGAEQYDLYRSLNTYASSIYRTIADTFYIDTLPEGAPLYYYFVRSKNSVSYSPVSIGYSGSRLRPPSTPISILVAGQLKAIYLNWGISATSANPTGFNIYRSIDNTNFKKIDSTKNYNYSDSVPDTIRYYYRISAYNALGESPISSSSYATLARPTAPQNLTGTLATSKAYIRITWSLVNSITKYALYRSLSADGTYEYLGSVENTNTYNDSTCNVNTTYYYKAASVIQGNKSILSNYTIGIRLGPPEIFGVGILNSGIEISWEQLKYPIQHFNIYKAATAAGPYVKIDNTTNNYYEDANGDETSYYKIASVNTVESDLSVGARSGNVKSTEEPQSVIATQGTKTDMITITWLAAKDAFAYKIYRAPTDSFTRNIIMIAEVSTTSFTDTVHSDSIYYYKVTTVKPSGEGGFSVDAVSGYRYPSAKPLPPVFAYAARENSGIRIGWYPSPTTIGYNSYNLYRSASSGGPFELVGSKPIKISTTSIIDTPPQKEPTVYWYYLTAVNQRGDSNPSMTVSGSY